MMKTNSNEGELRSLIDEGKKVKAALYENYGFIDFITLLQQNYLHTLEPYTKSSNRLTFKKFNIKLLTNLT